MPLAMTVDSLDAVPEAFRSEYTEKDGKFHLAVEGAEDVSGLKKALESERAMNRTTKEAIASWKKIGKTPEEINELVAAKEAAETEAKKKAGDFDGILKQHQTTWEKEKAALTSERDAARNAARDAVVNSALLAALTKGKALLDVEGNSEFLTDRLGKRIKLEIENGKATHTIMTADGNAPMAGSGENGSATYDDLVKEAVKKYPSLFAATGSGGGGKSPGDAKAGSGGDKTISRAEWDKLSPFDQAAKVKAGIKPVD